MKDKPPAIALVILLDGYTSREDVVKAGETVADHLTSFGVKVVKHGHTGRKYVEVLRDCGCCFERDEVYERYTFEFSPSKIKRRELDYMMEGAGVTKYKLIREGQKLKHPVRACECNEE